MKKLNKYSLLGIFCVFFIIPVYLPRTNAQEWTYKGADTERIPEFFVFPSERYYYNYTGGSLFFPETYLRFDIVKGNITDTFWGMNLIPPLPPLVNGTCIFGDVYLGNATSEEEILLQSDYQFVYWNETIGLITLMQFPVIYIPVEENGEATAESLEIAIESAQWAVEKALSGRFEHNASYPSLYSIELWNSTHNDAYYKMNFTENGHQIKTEMYNVPDGSNVTLISRPAQKSPQFSLTTESGDLKTKTTEIKLIANISDADNNNDKVIDTDYLYRIYNGTDWTTWAPITSLIDYDLGSIVDGDYDITMEVKNMYGVASDMITIQYTAPTEEIIPSYPIGIICLVAIFSVSIIILTKRKIIRL